MTATKHTIPEHITKESNPDVIFDYLKNVLTDYKFKINIDKVKEAYIFAKKAHFGQVRKS